MSYSDSEVNALLSKTLGAKQDDTIKEKGDYDSLLRHLSNRLDDQPASSVGRLTGRPLNVTEG